MAEDREPPTGALVPLPVRPLAPGQAWSQEIVASAFLLWASCRNAEAAARMLEHELRAAGHTGPTPSARTIRHWIDYHQWRQQADAAWREHKARDLFEVQAQAVAAVKIGLTNLLLAASGAFAENPQDGALRLKSAELAIRLVERGVIPLSVDPPADAIDTSGWSREQKEAHYSGLLSRGRHR